MEEKSNGNCNQNPSGIEYLDLDSLKNEFVNHLKFMAHSIRGLGNYNVLNHHVSGRNALIDYSQSPIRCVSPINGTNGVRNSHETGHVEPVIENCRSPVSHHTSDPVPPIVPNPKFNQSTRQLNQDQTSVQNDLRRLLTSLTLTQLAAKLTNDHLQAQNQSTDIPTNQQHTNILPTTSGAFSSISQSDAQGIQINGNDPNVIHSNNGTTVHTAPVTTSGSPHSKPHINNELMAAASVAQLIALHLNNAKIPAFSENPSSFEHNPSFQNITNNVNSNSEFDLSTPPSSMNPEDRPSVPIDPDSLPPIQPASRFRKARLYDRTEHWNYQRCSVQDTRIKVIPDWVREAEQKQLAEPFQRLLNESTRLPCLHCRELECIAESSNQTVQHSNLFRQNDPTYLLAQQARESRAELERREPGAKELFYFWTNGRRKDCMIPQTIPNNQSSQVFQFSDTHEGCVIQQQFLESAIRLVFPEHGQVIDQTAATHLPSSSDHVDPATAYLRRQFEVPSDAPQPPLTAPPDQPYVQQPPNIDNEGASNVAGGQLTNTPFPVAASTSAAVQQSQEHLSHMPDVVDNSYMIQQQQYHNLSNGNALAIDNTNPSSVIHNNTNGHHALIDNGFAVASANHHEMVYEQQHQRTLIDELSVRQRSDMVLRGEVHNSTSEVQTRLHQSLGAIHSAVLSAIDGELVALHSENANLHAEVDSLRAEVASLAHYRNAFNLIRPYVNQSLWNVLNSQCNIAAGAPAPPSPQNTPAPHQSAPAYQAAPLSQQQSSDTTNTDQGHRTNQQQYQ